eukprot:5976867-Karenia_brevis.AAC.2
MAPQEGAKKTERIRKERSRNEDEIKQTAQLTRQKPFARKCAPNRGRADGDDSEERTHCSNTLRTERRPRKGSTEWKGFGKNGAETRKR